MILRTPVQFPQAIDYSLPAVCIGALLALIAVPALAARRPVLALFLLIAALALMVGGVVDSFHHQPKIGNEAAGVAMVRGAAR